MLYTEVLFVKEKFVMINYRKEVKSGVAVPYGAV